MPKEHHYQINLQWTGNTGEGTAGYRTYLRDHVIHVDGKEIIKGSSDPAFRGDQARYNPEELLVAALSSCHMLAYLHLCAVNGIVVVDYTDETAGIMHENADGSGQFTEVTLYPVVTVTDDDMTAKAQQLHHEAHKLCFIARSCNFPVKHEPVCKVAGQRNL